MNRLRGNTFLLLLLRSGNQVLLNPQEYGESKEGVTKPNMLADLIRLTNPNYSPAKMDTLASYFSKYLAGEPPKSPSYLPFSNPAYRQGLSARLVDDRRSVLIQMDDFCRKYLDMGDASLRQLVAGVIDAVLSDDSFEGIIDIGEKSVQKLDLNKLDRNTPINLQAFLCSVWAIILESFPDTSEGIETYNEWTEFAGYNTARIPKTDIGFERAKKIAVSPDLPDGITAETAEEVHEKATEETIPDSESEAAIEPEVIEIQSPGEKATTRIQIINNGPGTVIGQANGLVINVN